MPVDQPFNVYRQQLTSLHHGLALWQPNPIENLYDEVSIGDVGYIEDGFFHRMFNVTLPWDDPSNTRLDEPEPYEPLDCGPRATTRGAPLAKGDYYSPHVSTEENANNVSAWNPDDLEGVRYQCRGQGALLSLPHDGDRKDVIRTKVFEDYIRDNVVA
ncbi:hypothetical protein F5148DRAFT_542386 [Russula earlei]|uniref:Uncharacterized protein n=1 Tax=Russula earlei TaxID=71964 RepID=A0ACC0UH86_9AGAM|nr:hypothetical protein F5148DRAFT_542386 [Russula earlei]